MTLSLNLILSALSDYKLVNHISYPEECGYSRISLLPSDETGMSPEYLYCCTLDQAQKLQSRQPACHYVCPEGEGEVPKNCMMVRGISSVTELAELLQSGFMRLVDWIGQMHGAVIDFCDYQQLLNLSEDILKNPVYVLDASYKLLAYTANIRDDDALDIKLLQTGYHSQDSLETIRSYGRIQAYKEQVGTLINPPGKPNKYSTVSRWLWDSGMPVIHVIMICSNKVPSPELIDLFNLLAENCASCFRHEQNSKNARTGRIYDSLLNDILFANLDNPRSIAERAKVANLPLNGVFDAYKIMLRDNDSYPIGRVLSELFNYLPDAKIISRTYEIIVLNCYYENADWHDCIDKGQKVIMPLLEKYDALCGVSEPFHALADLPSAYLQATKAIGIGDTLFRGEELWNRTVSTWGATHTARDRNLFRYDDVFIYYALSISHNGTTDLFYNTPYLSIARDLIRNDQEHGTNNAQVLYTYLVNERRATQTGAVLHMHRNNVLYRIPRIEELIGLNLDDYWVRLKLQLAFHLLELESAHQHESARR